MKYFLAFSMILFLTCCNQGKRNGGEKEPKDSTAHQRLPSTDSGSAKNTDTIIRYSADDSALLKLSEKVLTALRDKDFLKLATLVHPRQGLRFSAYAFVDTATEPVLSIAELRIMGKGQQPRNWGVFNEETGEALSMPLNKYIDRYIYPRDFLQAKKYSVNRFLGFGNSLNNLKSIYPGADFTEFYFPGFEPKYEGMDWQTLRLVFAKEGNNPFLIAVVHDEWTI